jgi:hypothetical protein
MTRYGKEICEQTSLNGHTVRTKMSLRTFLCYNKIFEAGYFIKKTSLFSLKFGDLNIQIAWCQL